MIQKLVAYSEALFRGLNHDFCPSFNRYVYWLKKPIGWVVSAALFSFLVGLFIAPQGFVLMWSFVALIAFGAAWPWLSMKGLSCTLFFDQKRSEENEPTHVIVEITNRWPIPAFGLLVSGKFLQELREEDDIVAVSLKHVPAWSVSRFEWEIKPSRRGRLPVEAPKLMTAFPFGFYDASSEIKVEGNTLVWPARQNLQGSPSVQGSQISIEGSASRRAGNDGDTIGVRDYRQGDSIKQVHWSQTARLNRIIVRERQACSSNPVRVIVDLTREHHEGDINQNSYEPSIRLAATICSHFHQRHAEINLKCLGLPENIASGSANRLGLTSILDHLALLPQLDSEFDRFVEPARHIGSRNQLTVLIRPEKADGAYSVSPNVLTFNVREDGSFEICQAKGEDSDFKANWLQSANGSAQSSWGGMKVAV